MKYIRDPTGRFPSRPFYDRAELDLECERTITEFMIQVHGQPMYPIPTDTLTKLIERDTRELDLYADLRLEGAGVEGVTEFQSGERPVVRIASELSTQEFNENRFRTTLTHEYGHVCFHDQLWQEKSKELDLFESETGELQQCRRETILQAAVTDWMEWQAGYASGALLMPSTEIGALVRKVFASEPHLGLVAADSRLGHGLVQRVAGAFSVSSAAARVRLLQLGHLAEAVGAEPLFE